MRVGTVCDMWPRCWQLSFRRSKKGSQLIAITRFLCANEFLNKGRFLSFARRFKEKTVCYLIPWFSTWQSQNSTTFWRKDLPTQLLHGIVGGISLWCHKLSQCDVLIWADSFFLQSTATFKSCWALWLWKLWLMMTLVSGNCILLTIYGNWRVFNNPGGISSWNPPKC